MITMRSSSASFSFSCRNLWNSARLVCARIVSSRWISGKRDTLTFFSRQREQQVQELALDLQDLDHLEQAAAGRVHRPRPRPVARITLVADLRDLGEIHRADEVRDVGGRGIVRRIGADAGARGLGVEYPLDRNPDEVAFVIALDEVARPGRELAADEDAVALAELGPETGRNEVQRVLAQRRAADGVERALLGAAVFLQPPLDEDRQRRLAARGLPEQQQQPPADVGAGGRGLEVVDHAGQRFVDAEELALEELPRARALGSVGLRRAPVPAQHVPDVFVTAAGESRGVARQYVAQKLAEGAFPALRAVQAAEGAQGVDEVGGSAAGSLLSRALSHRPSLPLGSWCSSTMPAIPATPAWCLR